MQLILVVVDGFWLFGERPHKWWRQNAKYWSRRAGVQVPICPITISYVRPNEYTTPTPAL